jgi:hypothetical protein
MTRIKRRLSLRPLVGPMWSLLEAASSSRRVLIIPNRVHHVTTLVTLGFVKSSAIGAQAQSHSLSLSLFGASIAAVGAKTGRNGVSIENLGGKSETEGAHSDTGGMSLEIGGQHLLG